MSGAFLRRRDQTGRPLRVDHYSAAVNSQSVEAAARSITVPEPEHGIETFGLPVRPFRFIRSQLRDVEGSCRHVPARKPRPPVASR